MHTVNIPILKQMIEHIVVRKREPLFVWGTFGGGKSSAVQQVCKEKGYFLCDIRASQYDSVDFRGLPDRDGDETKWLRPSTLPFVGNDAFPDDGIILLFLDEMNAATNPVSAVLYQCINDYRIGEHELKPNVRIVAAGNREGDRGVTNKQPAPLSNRFTHVELGVDVDAFSVWAQGAGILPVVIAFFQFRKPLLHTFDPAKPAKAICTPRTAEKMARYYADDEMPLAVKQAAMAGAVGQGVADEFWGFTKVWQQVAALMPRILKEPTTVPIPDELGMQYAVAVSISGSMNPTNMKPYYAFLDRMEPEFVVMAWQLAVQREPKNYSTPEFVSFSKKYDALFAP